MLQQSFVGKAKIRILGDNHVIEKFNIQQFSTFFNLFGNL